jgi:hypothetical protein
LTQALVPLHTELMGLGLSAFQAEQFLRPFTANMNEATAPAIADMSERISEQITLITALGQSLGRGAIDLGIFKDRMVALGFSTSEALVLADAALDRTGRSVDATGKVVRNFARMSDEAFKKF